MRCLGENQVVPEKAAGFQPQADVHECLRAPLSESSLPLRPTKLAEAQVERVLCVLPAKDTNASTKSFDVRIAVTRWAGY